MEDLYLSAVVWSSRSNHNPLHLVERDLVTCSVVELGRARAFVRGHELRVFERAANLSSS